MAEHRGDPFYKIDAWWAQRSRVPFWKRVPPWWLSLGVLVFGPVSSLALNEPDWRVVPRIVAGALLVVAIAVDLRRRRKRAVETSTGR